MSDTAGGEDLPSRSPFFDMRLEELTPVRLRRGATTFRKEKDPWEEHPAKRRKGCPRRRGRQPKQQRTPRLRAGRKKTGGKGTRSETVPSSAAQKKEALAENDGEVEALKETVAKLQEQLQAALSAKAAQPAQVIQVVTPDSEKVTMRFQADVADDNVAVFGPSGLYGQVTGKMGTVVVPKAEWSRFYTDSVRRMIDRRWLVVLTGMSEDERKLFHCAYKKGEVLDEKAFAGLLDMGEELLKIFPELCISHQRMVGKAFWEAYNQGDSRANDRTLIVKLNELSKKAAAGSGDKLLEKGVFNPVIEAMNKKDAD